QPAVLFTVIGVIGLSARDLATRRVPVETPSLSLAILGMGATIPAGLLLMGFSSTILVPTSNEVILIVLSIFIAVVAYSCI
ncbi:MAG: EamA/RhaT family transporter, partial [Planktomarina sp.]|nr:EamA/RhaT family transporter [Planktomarina sp.]